MILFNDIDKILSQWNQNYIGHDVVYMPPTWKNELNIPYTFAYVDSKLTRQEYAEFFKICIRNNIPNPRCFTSQTLEYASLFHPSFFYSVKYAENRSNAIEQYAKGLNNLQPNHSISATVDIASITYYLQSMVFLSGVTLSAAIVQNRWSLGTLESKLNRLWQVSALAKAANIKELIDLQIEDFIFKMALEIHLNPTKALHQIKLFFSKILKELVVAIPAQEQYIKATTLNQAQKIRFGFMEQLKTMLGDNLQAVILYGSATNSIKFSDYDLIIIVKDLEKGLQTMAGKSPTYNGLELNMSIFNHDSFWTYQLASGDNLMDHAICLYGEAKIPHKTPSDLLARNFSFGFIRFRQLLGMAAHIDNNITTSDDKRNLLDYFIKIPLNVCKGIQGCYGNITTNEEIRAWFIKTLNFDVEKEKALSRKGNNIDAISAAVWATQEVMDFYNEQLNLFSPMYNTPKRNVG